MPHDSILDKNKTAFVIIDLQEAFRTVIPDFERIVESVAVAIKGFSILNVPIIVTEQYPRGLGHTASEILDVLPSDTEVIEKTAFSSCGASVFLDKLTALGVTQIVLAGIEAHICVSQTAHDLLFNSFQVHLLIEAIGSRFDHNRQTGIQKMSMNGALPTSIEMALFELMGDAKHKKFKEIQQLIK